MEIRVLDEHTIDQIAAGEVVDRPASVVKELVENAVDAGADAVTVEIKEGGISLIRITDNGAGIAKEQVATAFLRHATSKIHAAADLQRLSSLGFRGEALSSICAVSQMEMITKVPGDLTGLRYVIESGAEKEAEEVGAPDGTTILVRNLFYNVPARRKFLKTAQTEAGYITDAMEHLSLSHPGISFKYVVNGQVKFHTSGNGDLKEVIYRIYGREIAGELVPLQWEDGGKILSGFIGTPAIGRANRNFETCFVNGRFIKSPLMSKAAEEAYKPYLMQHKFPFFVLHFYLEPALLDVNVHPSKMEVRFHAEKEIADFIFTAVRKTLSEREMLRQITFADENEKPEPKAKTAVHVPEPFEKRAREQCGAVQPKATPEPRETDDNKSEALWQIDYDKPEPETVAVAEEPVYPHLYGEQIPVSERREAEKLQNNIIKKDAHILVERPVQMNLFEEKLIARELQDEYRIIGQIFDTYWVVAVQDKVLFIDQHAAHEKVKYERLCRQIRDRKMLTQQVNPPAILTLSGKEEAAYQEYRQYFRNMGFEIEPFGGNEYAVRGVPSELFGHPASELLMEILDELTGGVLKGEADIIAEKLASMSCKAAVKGNHAMSREEAQALIDELLTLENPYHCPHGRPTVIVMSRRELEKRFGRIV